MSNETKNEAIVWTTLPNGVRNGVLRLSVLVVPRLSMNADELRLGQFDFKNWPEKDVRISVQFVGGPTISAKIISDRPDVRYWNTLFSDETLVYSDIDYDGNSTTSEMGQFIIPSESGRKKKSSKAMRAALANRPVMSASLRPINDFMKRVFTRTIIDFPDRLPSAKFLADKSLFGLIDFGSTKEAVDREKKLKAEIESKIKAKFNSLKTKNIARIKADRKEAKARMEKSIVPQGVESGVEAPLFSDEEIENQFAWARSTLFLPEDLDLEVQSIPPMDFHQMVSELGEYPEMLKRLGLVIDLEIPIEPNSVPPESAVRVIPTVDGGENFLHITPWTNYIVNSSGFMTAASDGSDIRNGMLMLNDDSFEVVQGAVETVAVSWPASATTFSLQAMQAIAALQAAVASQAGEVTITPGNSDDSDGEEAVSDEEAHIPSLQSGGISLVREERGEELMETRALNTQRDEEFRDLAEHHSNGIEQAAVANHLNAEELARGLRIDIWDSASRKWHSLCKRIGTYKLGPVPESPDLEFQFADEGCISTVASSRISEPESFLYIKGSLFHWTNWSLCAPRPGGFIDKDDRRALQLPVEDRTNAMNRTGFKLETDFTVPPRTLPRLRFGIDYLVRARVVDPAGNSLSLDSVVAAHPSYASRPVKYLRFEPVPSPLLVLRNALRGSESDSFLLKEGTSLERLVIRSNWDQSVAEYNLNPVDRVDERHIAPVKTSQLMAETHGMFDDPSQIDLAEFMESDLDNVKAAYRMIASKDPGELLKNHDEEQLTLPYMPDPLSRGVTIRQISGTVSPGETQIPFYKPDTAYAKWPTAGPFRIRLEDGAESSWTWDETNGIRVLSITLPQGESHVLHLSSYLREEDLSLMGIWSGVQEEQHELGKNEWEKIMDDAINGRNPQLTPFKKIYLVHAVQQPLIIPRFANLQSLKRVGWTFALLDDTMAVSRKSTSKVDVNATWSESVDDPLQDLPSDGINADKQTHSTHAFEIPVRYDHHSNEVKLNYRYRHEFGDTKYRSVSYTAIATTRYRNYFPEEIRDNTELITRTSVNPVTIDILNSARPAAPKVLYILPTFKWDDPITVRSGQERKRSGNGLRIYMERPWFSSGDGELLGVIVYTASGLIPQSKEPPAKEPPEFVVLQLPNQIPDEYKPYVTQWGVDPIWSSEPTYAIPSLVNFTNKVQQASGLTLDELPVGKRVSVAAFSVEYDTDRKLWYCDIEIDAGPSYFPFVRLALARYQPKSVPVREETVSKVLLLQEASSKGELKKSATFTKKEEDDTITIQVKDVHLSRVVLADFAQLAPDRWAGYTKVDENTLNVWISGPGYIRSEVGKMHEGGSEVEVSVESGGRNEDDPNWKYVASFQLSKPDGIRVPSTESPLWTGKVTLSGMTASESYRLVFKEYEVFYTDIDQNPMNKYKRLVYSDVLKI